MLMPLETINNAHLFLDAIVDTHSGDVCVPYIVVTGIGLIMGSMATAIVYLFKSAEKRMDRAESMLYAALKGNTEAEDKKAVG